MSTHYEIVSVTVGPFPLLNPERTAMYVSVVVKSKRGPLAQLHTVALQLRLSDGRADAVVVAGDRSWPHAADFIEPPPALNDFLEGVDFNAFAPVREVRAHPERCKTVKEAYGDDGPRRSP